MFGHLAFASTTSKKYEKNCTKKPWSNASSNSRPWRRRRLRRRRHWRQACLRRSTCEHSRVPADRCSACIPLWGGDRPRTSYHLTPVSTSSATKPPGLMRLMPYAPDEPPKLLRCPHRSRIDRERFARQPERRLLQYHSLGSLVPGANSAAGSTTRAANRDTGTRSRRLSARCNLRSIVSQNCLGLKTSTKKTELLGVLRWRRTFAACLQETWASRSCKRKAGSLSAQHRRRSEAVAVWA